MMLCPVFLCKFPCLSTCGSSPYGGFVKLSCWTSRYCMPYSLTRVNVKSNLLGK
uniref:Uncharacterized protein n=1 Tax=Anguilla anguilla TaxID=7936 RepID=A0A0E9RVS7_ANGAN